MLRTMILTTRLRAANPNVRGVRGGTEPLWTVAPSPAEVVQANRIVADTLGEFPDERLTAEEADRLAADDRLDRIGDADLLAIAEAVRGLPPTATAADVRARVKADRRTRRALR